VAESKTYPREAVRLLLESSKDRDSRITAAHLLASVHHLQFFGYFPTYLLRHPDLPELQQCIAAYQQRFGILPTGVIGPRTLKTISAPRCGCLDVPDPDNDVHVQFLRLQDKVAEKRNSWQKTGLTYFHRDFLPDLPIATQRQIIAAAWRAWDTICGISLAETTTESGADLIISTGRGSQNKFDGRGGVLAWAYTPNGKDKPLLMRFDLDEIWVTDASQRGVLLFNVACHEFGHMLGLSHSHVSGALLAPHYSPLIAVPQANDDIAKAVALYGTDPATILAPAAGDAPMFVITCRELSVSGYDLVKRE
jgi:hypothetical protein